MDYKTQTGQFQHSNNNKILFNLATKELPPADAMGMVDYITKNQIMQKSIAINDGDNKYALLSGLMTLAAKCPIESRIRLYSKLETAGILNTVFDQTGADSISHLISHLFEDVNINEALNRLEFSNAWLNLPKTSNLYDGVSEYDPRLLPAMQYSNPATANDYTREP